MKKRLYPPFRCSSEFPCRIPEILERSGLSARVGRWLPSGKPNPTAEFGYEVSDGKLFVVITGGTLPDGIIGYRVVPAMFDISLKFWLRAKKEDLRLRVQALLGENGGELWVDYPYD